MNGLVDRAIEEFLRATYGEDLLRSVSEDSSMPARPPLHGRQGGREALTRAAFRMSKPASEMLEDLGAWLTRIEPIRRLLRFSGRDLKDFLLSLEELPGRAHLVLPSLVIPRLLVTDLGDGVIIGMEGEALDWQPVLVGLIRGMADDYGALCLIAAEGAEIRVEIWEEQFAEGRLFRLHPDVLPNFAPL